MSAEVAQRLALCLLPVLFFFCSAGDHSQMIELCKGMSVEADSEILFVPEHSRCSAGYQNVRSLKIKKLYVEGVRPNFPYAELGRIQGIEFLSLRGARTLGDIAWLESGAAHSIKELILYDTGVSSLESLAGATRLERLNLQKTRVQSLEPLRNARRLKEIILADTSILSIEPLTGLPELESINLVNSGLEDFEQLGKLGSLTHLETDAAKTDWTTNLGQGMRHIMVYGRKGSRQSCGSKHKTCVVTFHERRPESF